MLCGNIALVRRAESSRPDGFPTSPLAGKVAAKRRVGGGGPERSSSLTPHPDPPPQGGREPEVGPSLRGPTYENLPTPTGVISGSPSAGRGGCAGRVSPAPSSRRR